MKRDFFYYLAPSLAQSVVGSVLLVPVITYYLDPKELGVVAALTALTLPIAPLTSTGEVWLLSGNWYRLSDQERKELIFNILVVTFGLKLFWTVVLWGASFTILPVIIREYQPEYQFFFTWVLVGIVLGSLWPTVSYVMVMEEASRANAAAELTQWLAGTITLIVGLAVLKMGLLAMFLGPVASGVVSTTVSVAFIRDRVSLKLGGRWLREVWARGVPTIPVNLADSIANSLDRLVIQWRLGLGDLGLYAHSQSYRGVFVLGSKAYSKMMAPMLQKSFTGTLSEEDIARQMNVWYRIVGVGGVLVALFSPEIVHVLTHGKFDRAAALVPIWFLLVLTQTFGLPPTQFLLYKGQQRPLASVTLLTTMGSIAVMVALTYAFGILGTAIALIGGSLAVQVVRLLLARRYGYLDSVGKSFLAAVAVIGMVYLGTRIATVSVLMKAIMALLILFTAVCVHGGLSAVRVAFKTVAGKGTA